MKRLIAGGLLSCLLILIATAGLAEKHAFLYSKGIFKDLETLGGDISEGSRH